MSASSHTWAVSSSYIHIRCESAVVRSPTSVDQNISIFTRVLYTDSRRARFTRLLTLSPSVIYSRNALHDGTPAVLAASRVHSMGVGRCRLFIDPNFKPYHGSRTYQTPGQSNYLFFHPYYRTSKRWLFYWNGPERHGWQLLYVLPFPSMLISESCNAQAGIDFLPDWAACRDLPFTTYQGYAGCGEDDLYTRCSGQTMWGIDGGGISWYVRSSPGRSESRTRILIASANSPVSCGTHSIFTNTDDPSPTPMIACAGAILDGLKLVRGDLRTTSSAGPTAGSGTDSTNPSPVQTNSKTSQSGESEDPSTTTTSGSLSTSTAAGIGLRAIALVIAALLLMSL